MARGGSSATSGSGGAFYGRESFNPGRIINQVLLLLVIMYVTDFWLLVIFDYMLGVRFGSRRAGQLAAVFSQMFDHSVLSLSTSRGIIAIGCFYVSVVGVCSVAFRSLVGRAKRALDFTVTIMLMHFACCAVFNGIPTSGTWWIVVSTAGLGMVIVSEVLSRRDELREIAVPARDVENGHVEDEDDIRPA